MPISNLSDLINIKTVGVGILFAVVAIWTIVWKGMSLWKAGQRKEKGWFVALLILNTLGILDILYIYVFSKPKKETPPVINQ